VRRRIIEFGERPPKHSFGEAEVDSPVIGEANSEAVDGDFRCAVSSHGGQKNCEEQQFEGLDVGLQFVTTRAAGKHDAGNEGAEGGRKTDRIHEKGSADDERDGGSRTSFAPSSERHPAQAQVVYGMPDRSPSVSKLGYR
tara:strand:+ start:2774 stop:3193 length:420 start_codon:yes stop_codon:yes gene_type:complete